MSWSLPRESFRPQRVSRSTEGSVRRPDFCTASLMRVSLSMLRPVDTLRRQGVAAIALGQVARHAADGGDADAGLAMNLAIGQAAPQALDHGPAVRHRLQFGRGTQVAQEGAAFLPAAPRDQDYDQVALALGLLARGMLSMGFNSLWAAMASFQCINVLVR